MTALIFRRLLQAIPVLFIVVTLTFLLVRSAPGNPFSTEKKIPAEIMEELEKQYDLRGTMWHQYLQYMTKVAHGNLGISTQYRNRTVNEIIAQTLPVSMTLWPRSPSISAVIDRIRKSSSTGPSTTPTPTPFPIHSVKPSPS